VLGGRIDIARLDCIDAVRTVRRGGERVPQPPTAPTAHPLPGEHGAVLSLGVHFAGLRRVLNVDAG